MEIHAEISGAQVDGIDLLRDKASNLALKNIKLIEAVEAGEALAEADKKHVEADIRIPEAAASAFSLAGCGEKAETCLICKLQPATAIGFVCRCRCLCVSCAAAGDRVKECPSCHDWTEFVQS